MSNQSQTQNVTDNLQAIAKANADAKAKREELAKKLQDIGHADGLRLATLNSEYQGKAGTLAREMLKQRASEFNGDAGKISDYLSGYRVVFGDSAQQRASEARAIMEAYAIDSARMDAFTGGYALTVNLAREIRGKRISPSVSKGSRKPSEKGMATIEGKVKTMTTGQAALIVQTGIAQIVAANPDNWELALLRQMDGMTVRLESSKQPIFQEIAKKIQAIAGELLNKAAIEQAAKDTKPETGAAPQPFTGAQPAQQKQEQPQEKAA